MANPFQKNSRTRVSIIGCLFFVGVVVVAQIAMSGCSKEKMDELRQSVNESIDKSKKAVKENVDAATNVASAKAGLSGSMTLSAGRTVPTEACYATFVEQQPDRSNVLKLQSYISAETESFPSALIQAQVDEISQTELSGKTVKAQVFIQHEQSGPIWSTNPDEPAEIAIDSMRDNVLKAKVVKGTVYNSQTGDSVQLKGNVEGIFH